MGDEPELDRKTFKLLGQYALNGWLEIADVFAEYDEPEDDGPDDDDEFDVPSFLR